VGKVGAEHIEPHRLGAGGEEERIVGIPASIHQLHVAARRVDRGDACAQRWVNEANVHTSTAYHPDNDGHALRIPEAAESWDSGYLVEPGDQFEVTLTVEGVYDYFCTPHEMAVMVGRIIVDRPSGPGTLPLDYFQGDAAAQGWRVVPEAAQAAFPAIEVIMRERVVRAAV
jgi:plastocyanin